MAQPRRFSLSLTDAQLDALRTAADTLLNIPSAEATERLFGRLSALDALHGRRIYRDAVKHDAERRARPHASNRRHNRIIGKMACVFVAFSFAAVDPFLTGGTAAFVNATRLAAAAAGDGEPTPLMQAEPSLLRPMWQPTPSIRFSTDVAGRFHSKNGQDQLALSLLGERGFFVDLATNHPVFISNTRALERDHGWTGICIEANPRYWTLIRAVRTCQLAGVAVASDERAVRFVDSRKGGFGHIDREGSQRSTRESEHAFEVRTMPLSTVLAELRAPPTISFLSLDVEGAEPSVLQSFPWGTHVASLMTIETVTEPMAAELRRHGYRLLCGMQGDECWVHQSAVLGPAALSRIVDCGGAGMRCEPVVASVRQQAARRRPNATGWECQDLSPRIRMQWLHAKPTKAGRIRDAGADLRASPRRVR